MNQKLLYTSILLTATLSGLSQALETQKTDSAPLGKCWGANGCKGQSDCATPTASDKGKNSCKGQGWKKTEQADCKDKDGKALKWEKI